MVADSLGISSREVQAYVNVVSSVVLSTVAQTSSIQYHLGNLLEVHIVRPTY